MKIAHVVSAFSPQLGGMGTVCADEAKSLAQQGHEVTVFTLLYSSSVDYTEHDKKFPFKIVRLKPLIKIGDAGFVPQLLWKIGNNFDLVHLHYPFYGGAEWLSFLRVPLIITYHMDAQLSGLKLYIQKLYDSVWPKFLLGRAKKILVVNANFFNSIFLKNINRAKVVEISNGIDIDIFKPEVPEWESLGLSSLKNKKIILFIGNFLPLKRLDILIEAVKLINDTEAVLLIIGDGQDSYKYKQLVKDLGVESRVYFAGSCHDAKKMARYYNIASCVVVPSDYESFSLVAIEAMACAKPLILADLPYFKNKFEEAYLFKKGSAQDLQHILEKVLSMPKEQFKKIGEQEREKVVTHYSWKNHINKLVELYERI